MQEKKQAPRTTMALPNDILWNILSRLPINTLRRFKCLSKQWYHLISDTNFIRLHSTRFEHLVFTGYDGHLCCNGLTPPDLGCIELPSHLKKANAIGYCNGFILCSVFECNGYEDKQFMYGVVDGSCKEIPYPETCPWPRTNGVVSSRRRKMFGFGYDSKSGDFKVVLVTRIVSDFRKQPMFFDPDMDVQDVRVYDSKSNMWRKVLDKLPNGLYPAIHYGNNFLNNALHWPATGPLCDLDCVRVRGIACFDLNHETFYDIPPPDFDAIGDEIDQGLAVLGERLHLIHYDPSEDRLHVYVMVEYGVRESWIKLCRVDKSGGFFRPMAYCEEGREIWFQRKGSRGRPCRLGISWIG